MTDARAAGGLRAWQHLHRHFNRLRRHVGGLLIDREAVERQQLLMLARQCQIDAFSSAFFGLVLCVFLDSPLALFDAAHPGQVWIWYAVFIIWVPTMVLTGRRLQGTDPPRIRVRTWRWRMTLLYLLNGMVWISFMYAAWSEDNVAVQALVMIVILGHLTTYLVNLGPHMLVFLFPAVAVLTGAEALMLHFDSELAAFGSVTYPLYGLYLLLLGRDAHRRLSAALLRSTELQEMADNLEEARARAVRQGEARSRFFDAMSHELRTPLNAIIGFSELMQQQVHGPIGHRSYQGYVGDISSSGRHLLRLVDDLLDMSSVEQQSLVVTPERSDLDELLAQVRMVLSPLADRKNLTLELMSADGVQATFDPFRMKQVLINLGSNAIKFTPDGGQVRLTWKTDAAGALLLIISDNGVGIGPDDLALVFDPFRQVQSAGVARKVNHGTGLGLTISRGLVERHGGTLILQSQPGQGTRAIVRLPNAEIGTEPRSRFGT
ncbi:MULTISPECIES: HAMP domain-containing sensor histidine kinase [unclassified Minwuia]|jgi:signal transduction histidine kinase|uniref:sensor histidine kinase n=1 Tax=unclassified Minwuia TaxID=2618799 RepID=UPI00247AE96C|nr:MULTISPECIES: HAMP domain-containing sensor histidine kinase [unclassified Minwuia]